MSRTFVAYGTLLLLGAACTPTSSDIVAETQKLLDTDRAWAEQASSGKVADSVLAYWDDSASVVMAGPPPVTGKDALRRMVVTNFATPGFHISWTPEHAVVSKAGDMGYTTGTNEVTAPDGTGKTTKVPGRYLTVWRKDSQGRWRCVEDYTTPSAPPPTTAAAK